MKKVKVKPTHPVLRKLIEVLASECHLAKNPPKGKRSGPISATRGIMNDIMATVDLKAHDSPFESGNIEVVKAMQRNLEGEP